MRRWRMRGWQCECSVEAVAFSHHLPHVAMSAGMDGRLILWDLAAAVAGEGAMLECLGLEVELLDWNFSWHLVGLFAAMLVAMQTSAPQVASEQSSVLAGQGKLSWVTHGLSCPA